MLWKEHLKWGLVSVTITLILIIINELFDFITIPWVFKFWVFETKELTWWIFPIAFGVGAYSSLLPDIDIETSKAYGFTMLMFIGLIAYYLLIVELTWPIIIILVIMVIMMGLKHRGITHSILAGLIISLFFMWVFASILPGITCLVGYCTHLLCDWVQQ